MTPCRLNLDTHGGGWYIKKIKIHKNVKRCSCRNGSESGFGWVLESQNLGISPELWLLKVMGSSPIEHYF